MGNTMGNESSSALEKASTGERLTSAEKSALKELMAGLDAKSERTQPMDQDKLTEALRATINTRAPEENKGNEPPPDKQLRKPLDEAVIQQIHQVSLTELSRMMHEGYISEEQFEAELQRRPKDKAFTLAESVTDVPDEYRNLTPTEAEKFIRENVLRGQQRGLLDKLKKFNDQGAFYSVSVGKDNRGYHLVRFQTPNPWDNVKKDAAQSVTREIRRETGKQLSRLINPDYSHIEIVNQYKLVRDALPQGSATSQALNKVDGAVKILLTTSGVTVEAVNLLVNAVRGALLEAPELKYKVAALLPDDVVRQGFVAAVRAEGNTLRRYIHEKYHLPDRPKQTPILVNTLDQIKPEHYRQQDAQKVGVDMRDLNREKAREFIMSNVPVEKQASALETIDRLPGNTFGVQIMDSGWVRISASAREPKNYDERPRYDNRQKWVGSYDATNNPKP